jgi:hypothetical protein
MDTRYKDTYYKLKKLKKTKIKREINMNFEFINEKMNYNKRDER